MEPHIFRSIWGGVRTLWPPLDTSKHGVSEQAVKWAACSSLARQKCAEQLLASPAIALRWRVGNQPTRVVRFADRLFDALRRRSADTVVRHPTFWGRGLPITVEVCKAHIPHFDTIHGFFLVKRRVGLDLVVLVPNPLEPTMRDSCHIHIPTADGWANGESRVPNREVGQKYR